MIHQLPRRSPAPPPAPMPGILRALAMTIMIASATFAVGGWLLACFGLAKLW